MAVPKFYEFFTHVISCLQAGGVMHVREIRQFCYDEMHLSADELAQMLPSEKQPTVVNRIHWAIQYLKKAGLIMSPSRAMYQITDLGVMALKSGACIDLKYLQQFPSFVAFHQTKAKPADVPVTIEPVTPVESFEEAYEKIRRDLADEVIAAVMRGSPTFFEHLVVDLLLKIGYGGAFEDAGIVTRTSGDEGIDGIIREDKLGFNSIYIQAKRWQPEQTIGRPEIQKFAGALLGQGASKGLFITTAHFSSEAKKYADSISSPTSKIVLIDGEQLAQLMITYNVGVAVQRTYEIKRIDSDYFDEE
ncbi:MAG: restriction endonuclease [Clostridia bacterium]|nr:restriction endonuclease [Clostridia bacterium]